MSSRFSLPSLRAFGRYPRHCSISCSSVNLARLHESACRGGTKTRDFLLESSSYCLRSFSDSRLSARTRISSEARFLTESKHFKRLEEMKFSHCAKEVEIRLASALFCAFLRISFSRLECHSNQTLSIQSSDLESDLEFPLLFLKTRLHFPLLFPQLDKPQTPLEQCQKLYR